MNTPVFEKRTAPPRATIIKHLLHANEVGRHVMEHGHHPFGALLVAPDGETVLMQQGNVSTVEHADTVMLQQAARNYSPEFLWQCTIYVGVEPCCMCAGTMYWANVGCVVFGMTEERLLDFTGSNPQNPTMSLPSPEVFARGQKPVLLIGPVPEVEEVVADLHRSFWKKHP